MLKCYNRETKLFQIIFTLLNLMTCLSYVASAFWPVLFALFVAMATGLDNSRFCRYQLSIFPSPLYINHEWTVDIQGHSGPEICAEPLSGLLFQLLGPFSLLSSCLWRLIIVFLGKRWTLFQHAALFLAWRLYISSLDFPMISVFASTLLYELCQNNRKVYTEDSAEETGYCGGQVRKLHSCFFLSFFSVRSLLMQFYYFTILTELKR